MDINVAILRQLEGRLAERINEHADLAGIELGTDGLYRAQATYDGLNDRGYRGHVTFSFRVVADDVVEDFQLINFEGAGLANPDIKFD